LEKTANKDLHKAYSLPSIIRMNSRRMRWAGNIARLGAKRNAYRTWAGMPEGKRSLSISRHSCVDNMKMDLREAG
jgi:hypothetical protein